MTASRAGFADNFSAVADAYRKFRPRYPAALFDYLADLAPARKLAWDCGCGNGQAALGLAEHFERVHASDASSAQIAQAEPDPRVAYALERAEHSRLADDSVDLVLAAQAIHWFDIEKFYREVKRVARDGAALAVLGYARIRIAPEIDRLMTRLYDGVLEQYPTKWNRLRC